MLEPQTRPHAPPGSGRISGSSTGSLTQAGVLGDIAQGLTASSIETQGPQAVDKSHNLLQDLHQDP